jgi:hypothetical protein
MTKAKKTCFTTPGIVQSIRCRIASGKKGKLRIQKSKRVFRASRQANLASSRELSPQESPVENISIMTPETQCTPASSMSSLTQESTKYKKHGVTFNEFIEGNGNSEKEEKLQ